MKKYISVSLFIFFSSFFTYTLADAATIYLKDGSVVQGTIVEEKTESIVVELPEGFTLEIPKTDILYIDKDNETTSSSISIPLNQLNNLDVPDKSAPQQTSQEKPDVKEEKGDLDRNLLLVSMKKRFTVGGSISMIRSVQDQLVGVGIYGDFWLNDYVSFGMYFRLALYSPRGRMGAQGTIETRIHATTLEGVYRPFIGVILGFVSDYIKPAIPRFFLGTSISVLTFVSKNTFLDVGHCEFLFIKEPVVDDSDWGRELEHPLHFDFLIDFVRIGYLIPNKKSKRT